MKAAKKYGSRRFDVELELTEDGNDMLVKIKTPRTTILHAIVRYIRTEPTYEEVSQNYAKFLMLKYDFYANNQKMTWQELEFAFEQEYTYLTKAKTQLELF